MSEQAALLLTDIVDSTRLGEALGDAAMSALWAEHDRLARDLLREWRGREIDKSDGFLLLFADAGDAVGYALDYHRALGRMSHPLCARAGLHVGPVIVRENPGEDVARGAKPIEVDGAAKPLAARVMAIARRGQILLTEAARAALGETRYRTVSHGHWRMKGVDRPVELFQVGDADAQFLPAQDGEKAYRVVRAGEDWLPAREIPHRLPGENDAFVGRKRILDRTAAAMAEGVRLASFVGMGGVGKTRLAIHFAKVWLGEFPGGAWFCDLSQARSLDGMFLAVAQGLDVPLGKADPAVQLGHAIAGRGRCLVILDNVEQVVGPAGPIVGRWLDRATEACFLVTTREALGLPGEHLIRIEPLAVTEGTELFLERARVAPSASLGLSVDRDAIEQLVRLLDGLPLAIELAVGRLQVMTPKTMLARIGERFTLLSTSKGRDRRQATLRATFDWSWDLLHDAEKAVLAQTSVFVGGFTLSAAEQVCDLQAVAGERSVVDALQSLIDKSFVRQLVPERFDLLESVREYAASRLESSAAYPGSGDTARRAVEARHGRYYASLSSDRAGVRELRDIENVVAACRRAVASANTAIAVRACSAAWELLRLRGPYRLAIELAAAVEAMSGIAEGDFANLLFVRGRSLFVSGDRERAKPYLVRAREESARLGDHHAEGRALASLAEGSLLEGSIDEAAPLYKAALAAADRSGDSSLKCSVLNGYGTYFNNMGLHVEAREQFEAALELARATGDLRWEAGSLGNLGQVFAVLGFGDRAVEFHERAVSMSQEIGDRLWEGNMLCNLGWLQHQAGNDEAARQRLELALQIARDLGFPRLESPVLCNLGLVYAALDRQEDAMLAFSSAVDIARSVNDKRSQGQFLGYLGALQARRGQIDDARASLRTGETILRGVRDRISLAVLLCARSETEWQSGDVSSARRALDEASAIATEAGVQPGSELAVALKRVRDLGSASERAALPLDST